MSMLPDILRRYRLFLLALCAAAVLSAWDAGRGARAFSLAGSSALEMLSFIPPIFILLGLLDVWVDRETMMKFMGRQTGLKGHFLAFMLGSLAAGPLYMAFPIAAMLIRKGASLFNVFLFTGVWATTKVPMLLFEASSLGLGYAMVRLCFNVAGIALISWVLCKTVSADEEKAFEARAEHMQGQSDVTALSSRQEKGSMLSRQ